MIITVLNNDESENKLEEQKEASSFLPSDRLVSIGVVKGQSNLAKQV